MLSSYSQTTNSNESISFGDNSKGSVVGLGKVAFSLDHSISNVLHVDSLKYNLLSVSQLCEMGYNCLFTDKGVEVSKREDSSIVFMGHLKNKLYLVDFSKGKAKLETCLVAKSSMGWLWHRRLAHVVMRTWHLWIRTMIIRCARSYICIVAFVIIHLVPHVHVTI